MGIGSKCTTGKEKLTIDGCCANVKLNKGDDVKFIIKAVDNNTDPLSIISIFPFDAGNKKQRKAEMSSLSTFFGGASSNNLKYVPFSAKKYGKSSYIITLNKQEPGEYGIVVKNPNALDQKNVIVSTFSIQ